MTSNPAPVAQTEVWGNRNFLPNSSTVRVSRVPVPGNKKAVAEGALFQNYNEVKEAFEKAVDENLKKKVSVVDGQVSTGTCYYALFKLKDNEAAAITKPDTQVPLTLSVPRGSSKTNWKCTIEQEPSAAAASSPPQAAAAAASTRHEAPPQAAAATRDGTPPPPSVKVTAEASAPMRSTAEKRAKNWRKDMERVSAKMKGTYRIMSLLGEFSFDPKEVVTLMKPDVIVVPNREEEEKFEGYEKAVRQENPTQSSVAFLLRVGAFPEPLYLGMVDSVIGQASCAHIVLLEQDLVKKSKGEEVHPYLCLLIAGYPFNDLSILQPDVKKCLKKVPTIACIGQCSDPSEFCSINDGLRWTCSPTVLPCAFAGTCGARGGKLVWPPPFDASYSAVLHDAGVAPLVMDLKTEQKSAQLNPYDALSASVFVYRQNGARFDVLLKEFTFSQKRGEPRKTKFGLMSQRVVDGDNTVAAAADQWAPVRSAAVKGLEMASQEALSIALRDNVALSLEKKGKPELITSNGVAIFFVNAQENAEPNDNTTSLWGLQRLPIHFQNLCSVASLGQELQWHRCDVLAKKELEVQAKKADALVGYSDTLIQVMAEKDSDDLCKAFFTAFDVPIPGISKVNSHTVVSQEGAIYTSREIFSEIQEAQHETIFELQKIEKQIQRLRLIEDEPVPDLEVLNVGSAEYKDAIRICRDNGGAVEEPYAVIKVNNSADAESVVDKVSDVQNLQRVFHTTKSAQAGVDIALGGPDFARAGNGNSGCGFYGAPSLGVSRGYGNTTLLCRFLCGNELVCQSFQGTTAENLQKLAAQQKDSVFAGGGYERVIYTKEQFHCDYIVFWKTQDQTEKVVVDNILQKVRDVYKDAKLAAENFKAELQELKLKKTHFRALLSMLTILQKTETDENSAKRLFEAEKAEFANRFPIYSVKPLFIEEVRSQYHPETRHTLPSTVLRIEAQTGSGKTTMLPQYIIDHIFKPRVTKRDRVQRVLVLVPTRLIAMNLSEFVADLRNTTVGGEIGYSIGGSRKMDCKGYGTTRVVFMTYMMFVRGELRVNPELHTYDCLLFDEAHKQQEDVIVSLALIPSIQKRRPDLIISLMSATLTDDQKKASSFEKVFSVDTRMFPIKDEDRPPSDDQDLDKIDAHIIEVCKEIISQGLKGNILCFLPTIALCRQTLTAAKNCPAFANLELIELHAQASKKARLEVSKSCPPGKFRVVFATSYAEEGVSLADIAYVLDCGRTMLPSNTSWGKSLEVRYVNTNTTDQRKGRTGRMCPGTYYRLYDPEKIRKAPSPTDKKEFVCVSWIDWIPILLSHGITSVPELPLPHPASHSELTDAYVKLQNLGVVSAEGNLTPLGEVVASMPFPTELSCFAVRCSRFCDRKNKSYLYPALFAVSAWKEDKLNRGIWNNPNNSAQTYLQGVKKGSSELYGMYRALADGFAIFNPSEKAGSRLPPDFNGIEDFHFENMWNDVQKAAECIQFGSPAEQKKRLETHLDKECPSLKEFFCDRCKSISEMAELIESADEWFADDPPEGLTKAEFKRLKPSQDDIRGFELTTEPDMEEAFIIAAVEVFRFKVAIPNDPTTLDKQCIVTNRELDMAMIGDKKSFLRRNLNGGECIVFGFMEKVRTTNLMTFLHLPTIVDRAIVPETAIQLTHQITGFFQGTESGTANGAVPTGPQFMTQQFKFKITVPNEHPSAANHFAPKDEKHKTRTLPGIPNAVAFPENNGFSIAYTGSTNKHDIQVTSYVCTTCGLFPHLFELQRTQPPDVKDIKSFFVFVMWVLVNDCGLSVYGGAVRDLIIRDELAKDIDVAISQQQFNQGSAQLFASVSNVLQGRKLYQNVTLVVTQQPSTPSVTLTVTVSSSDGRYTAPLEFVYPDNPAFQTQMVDMSCNNVQVTKNGLEQKKIGQGGPLSLCVWQIIRKKGTLLDTRNYLYQQKRRKKMSNRGWKLWNMDGNFNFDPQRTLPPSERPSQDGVVDLCKPQ